MLPKTRRSVSETAPEPARSRQALPHLVVARAEHEITNTASRGITSPADFLNALRWALKSGLHPRANATTLRVAELLVAKSNRRGHLAYGRLALAERLGLSVDCVAVHTRVLRELGLLVWIEHGSRANILRTRNPGQEPTSYKGTGTIFAMVVPPAYDQAHGRRISGFGYHARVVGVTDRGRRHEARLARAASPSRSTRPNAGVTSPPSRGGCSSEQSLQAGGTRNYTRARAHDHESDGPGSSKALPVTPSRVREFIEFTRAVQALVPWLRPACPRRLSYLLRDRLLAHSVTPRELASELLYVPKTLVRTPLAYLAHYLKRAKDGRGESLVRADLPTSWAEVPIVAPRPSPIPLLPLVSRRFLGEQDHPGASLANMPALQAAWEQREVAKAIERTLAYWRAQDEDRPHPWDEVGRDDPFADDSSRLPRHGYEWIPVYGS
ncbi:hypothetical protein [Kitasatospora indigofera]|uniref:hypothetical protein n=1 Tax=Kitasatospora indigofera TaxID=67307 RepID=UPI0033AB80A0